MRLSRKRWLFVTIALLLILGAAGFVWLRYATLPTLAGTLRLPGLEESVVIEREPSGMVHIRAKRDLDLFFAQGVVHAQDRLWQMEYQRRIGAGRLAELFGPEAVDHDRYLRTWGCYRAAQTAYMQLNSEARAVVDAYVSGINAYLASDPPLPPEFLMLDVQPEPWTGPDVLVWSKMMAYNLADNRRAELRRYRLLARGLSPERIATLMPLYPGETPPTAQGSVADAQAPAARDHAAEHQAEALLAMHRAQRQHLPQASNNWVVHGSRTKTGLPLLANDTHLGMQLPSTWYLVHLKSPDFDVIGASLPGLPSVTIGRNRHIAWGVTNLAADVEDLYIIEPSSDDGGYVYAGQRRPFEMRDEVIAVKGGQPVRFRVRETLYGPVISDAVGQTDAGPVLALRWIGLDPDDTTLEAFLGISRARDWAGFRAAMQQYVVPGQNFVYADRAGHIGYLASGRLPRRRPGHSGLYPVPGDGAWDWLGHLSPDELPRQYDPPEGVLLSANNRITGPDYPHRLSLEWGAEPYRAARIEQWLAARPLHDRASMQALQQDTLTLLHADFRPVLEALQPRSEAGRRWRERLLAWDGQVGAKSVESSVFEAWYTMLSTLPEQETGEPYWHQPRFLRDAMTSGDPLCTERGGSCLDFAADALDRALERVGDDPPPWGELHRVHLPHPVLTHTPLALLADRVLPHGGSRYTVNVGWYRPQDLVMFHGASYRQIIDMADPERSLFVLAGGQSGHWLSPRYDDQLSLWQGGEYLPMRTRNYSVADELLLKPVE